MNQRDEIVNALAKAASFQEQAALVSALDTFDRDAAAAHAAGRDADWANMVVTSTLTPVAVHERSTIETDWLGQVEASASDPEIIAEAAAWYRRVHPAVKADATEFAEQAKGIAHRTASQYGEQAAGIEASFLDYVHFLNRREAASGLDQVQQLVDSHENPKQTGLPADVFDTFGPPVHPINQGVTGTETSERAPLINEIEQEGSGGSSESHHDTSQQFQGPSPVEARPGVQGTTASRVTEPLFTPTVGLSHTATVQDFMPGGRFHKEAHTDHDSGCPVFQTHDDSDCTCSRHQSVRTASGGTPCPDCGSISDHKDDCAINGSKKEASNYPAAEGGLVNPGACQGCGASSPQHRSAGNVPLCGNCKDRPDSLIHTPYSYDSNGNHSTRRQAARDGEPTGSEHARSCSIFTGGHDASGNFKPVACDCHLSKNAASGLPQVQQTVDAITEQPAETPLPEEVAFPWDLEQAPVIDERSDHKAKREAALAYLRGLNLQPMASLTDVQRLQVAAYRKHADQWTQGNPQYHGPGAANSPETTPVGTGGTFEQGVAQGRSDYQTDGAPTFADASGAVPPFVQGASEGYGEAAAADSGPAGQMPPGAGGFGEYQTHAASLQTTAVKMNCTNCGRQDSHYNMTIRGNGQNQQAWCTNCKPVAADHGLNDSTRSAPVTRQASVEPKTSSLFVTAVEMADPEFAKAYKYASTWAPGKRLVRRHASKVSFEAGLYAGISDNTQSNQVDWEVAHRKAAKRYNDKGFTERIALHSSFTTKVAKAMPSLKIHGSYVKQAEPLQATAATSTELDTSAPGVSPSPTGQTPINGPGTTPPMAGQSDPAAPGGPSPYNGAEPFGTPAVGQGPAAHGQPLAIDTQPGAPVDQAAYEHLSPQTHAFRKQVQANLLALGTNQS